MAVQSITEAYQNLANIEDKSARDRKADFLRPLAIGMIGLLGVALLIMAVTAPRPQWYGFLIVGVGFLLNIGIFLLNKRGHTELAAQLFCYVFNLECLVLYVANISLQISDPSQDAADTILMGMVMTLSILLAGMLFSRRAGFWFAAVNMALIFIPHLLLDLSLIHI